MDNSVGRRCSKCHHEDGPDRKSFRMVEVKQELKEEIDDTDTANTSIFNSSSTSIETVIHAPVQSQVVNSSTGGACPNNIERMTNNDLNDAIPLGGSASVSFEHPHENLDFGGLHISRSHDHYGNHAICNHHHPRQYHHQHQMQPNGAYSYFSNDHTYVQNPHHFATHHHHPYMRPGVSQGFYDRPVIRNHYEQWLHTHEPYYNNPMYTHTAPFYSVIPGVPLPRFHEHIPYPYPHPQPRQGYPPQFYPSHGNQQPPQPGAPLPQPPPRATQSNEGDCLAKEILEFFNSSIRQLNNLVAKVDTARPCVVPLKEVADNVRKVKDRFTTDFVVNGHKNHGPTYCSVGPVRAESDNGGRTDRQSRDPFTLRQYENRNKSRKRQKIEIKSE